MGLSTSSWHWKTLARHPVFDGKPHRSRRGPLGNAKLAYSLGAAELAAQLTPVFSESGEVFRGQGTIRGPFLAWSADPIGNRVPDLRHHEGILRELSQSPEGDRGAAHAIVLHYASRRAQRHWVRLEHDVAWLTLRMVSRMRGILPPTITCGKQTPAAPRFVVEPDRFLATYGDIDRQAAAYLWYCGERSKAIQFLEQLERSGDPYALLQLSWLFEVDGKAGPAAAARKAFEERVR